MLWLEAVLVKKQLWSILGRRCLAHAAFDMADMRCFTYKLEAVLIAGNYAAVPPGGAAPHSDRTEQIIGLVALKLKAQDAHCVKHLLEYRHLNGQLLGHALALSLISGVSQVPERRRFEIKRNAHSLGLFIVKQLAEYGKEAVHAVCGRSVGRREGAYAVKRAVYYAVSVKYQKFHHFTSPRRRTISSLS